MDQGINLIDMFPYKTFPLVKLFHWSIKKRSYARKTALKGTIQEAKMSPLSKISLCQSFVLWYFI
jgi:hypothetical protein